MKKRTRYLVALAAAALVALAVAAPVVAHQLGTRGMSGTLPLYNAAVYDGSKVDRHGAEGKVWFDMTTKPYKITYLLTAWDLKKRTKYALVNFYCDNKDMGLGVHVLKETTSTRRGSLTMRGSAGINNLEEFAPDPWFTGAQLGLVPSSALNNVGEMVWVKDADVVLYAVAGLPIVLLKSAQ